MKLKIIIYVSDWKKKAFISMKKIFARNLVVLLFYTMTLQEFIQLNEVEQEEVVWDNGSFIATKDNDDLIYDIYKVDSFYVQFSYLLGKPETVTIAASTNVNQLNSSINAA